VISCPRAREGTEGITTSTGAGEDKTLRRWRITLTIFAWLFIVQAGFGFLSALLSIPLLATFRPESLAAQLGPLLSGTNFAAIDRLFASLRTLNLAQVFLNAVVLAGAVGLLLRHKWGWYLTVVLNVLQTAAAVAFGPPVLEQVLSLLDPAQAGTLSWTIAVLIALIPASIVAFLMLRPVVDQFERRALPAAETTSVSADSGRRADP
jgi:hypothetical protein